MTGPRHCLPTDWSALLISVNHSCCSGPGLAPPLVFVMCVKRFATRSFLVCQCQTRGHFSRMEACFHSCRLPCHPAALFRCCICDLGSAEMKLWILGCWCRCRKMISPFLGDSGDQDAFFSPQSHPWCLLAAESVRLLSVSLLSPFGWGRCCCLGEAVSSSAPHLRKTQILHLQNDVF